MVRVLVAGADGPLGVRVLALARDDDDIEVVTPGDGSNGDGAVDVIVHLGSGDHDRLARRRQNITEGVDRTLAEAINRDAGHLVLVSSAMVYGAWPNNPVPLTEDAILRPDVGFVYAHGRVLKKVSSDILVEELFHEIDKWIGEGMYRPKRLKMAKPAALAMAEASAIPLE